jgi:solute carrier family 35 protein E1
VVKALEPVFTAAITLLVLGKNMPWQVWLSMLPVCGGVAMASAGELSFNMGCFLCAMLSNLVYATRGVLSKASMESKDPGENMTAENTFALVTLMSFIFCLPAALILEGAKIPAGLAAVAATGVSQQVFAQNVIITGLLYYTYNEMAFLVLGSVAPVTQSVGNTVKRVVVIVAAALAFQTPMTPIGIAGSAIAIAGVLLYSIVKGMYPDLPAKKSQ